MSRRAPRASARAAPGRLEVRLARSGAEIDAAQALRFRVFCEELGGRASPEAAARGRDADRYDAVADHLVALDHQAPGGPAVVGTYRLLGREAAARAGGFYSQGEFDLGPILAWPGEVLELGRACVDPGARDLPVMHLLWRGIAEEVFRRRASLLFGCASFHGADPGRCSAALAWLRRHHLAPPALRPRALPHLRAPPEPGAGAGAVDDPPPDLPPLVKGVLRLGGFIGEGAAIDREMNTVDVLVMVRTGEATGRYLRHYARLAAAAGGDAPPPGGRQPGWRRQASSARWAEGVLLYRQPGGSRCSG